MGLFGEVIKEDFDKKSKSKILRVYFNRKDGYNLFLVLAVFFV